VSRGGVAFALAAAFAFAATPSPASADAVAGRTKAQMCATCHGANGLAVAPNTPHLAGQPEPYLVEQLKAYRSGKRAHEVMGVVAKPLTDADIADLAAWFASLEIVLKKEP
jgi:cytochrome c553